MQIIPTLCGRSFAKKIEVLSQAEYRLCLGERHRSWRKMRLLWHGWNGGPRRRVCAQFGRMQRHARSRPLVTGDIAGGLWSPQGRAGGLTAWARGQALAIAFRKAGGRLVANEAVVRIERREGRAAAALTTFGHYPADAFVLAAGAVERFARTAAGARLWP